MVYATIELHGATLMMRTESYVVPCPSLSFLPGDRVNYVNDTVTLVSRQSHVCVAVIRSINNTECILYFPHLTHACPSQLTVFGSYYSVGDRIVVHLKSDGHIEVKSRMSELPIYDAVLLSTAYYCHDDMELPERIKQEPLYTEKWVDHRDLDTFTIDPSTTVDVDDAISVNVAERTIYIHIVDTVKAELSEQERLRMKQGVSTLYLSNERTEHLLSDVRLQELSLHAGHDRHAVTVRVTLFDDGTVQSYGIYPSMIQVKNRYHYEDTPDRKDWVWLHELTRLRTEKMTYIDLPSIRFRVIDGFAVDITTEDTVHGTHAMVSMSMILANLIVSTHLNKHLSGLIPNRFHATLRGQPITLPESVDPHVASYMRIKKYARATYDIDQRGHFGLGITDYVHFTSPMRRYSDTIIHDLLAGYIYKRPVLEKEIDWINIRSAQVKGYQSVYTGWKIGRYLASTSIYTLWVTDVKKSGIMWFIPHLSLHGFAHVSMLRPVQYWKFNQDTLCGQTTFSVFECGKSYHGSLVSVDPITFAVQFQVYAR
jgi:exoribonuclease-2